MADPFVKTDTAAELFFYLLDTAGSPATGQTGTPEVRKNGGAWVTDGVSELSESGNGHYSCTVDLTDVTLAAAVGDILDGRVKTVGAKEAPSLNEIMVVETLAYQRLIQGAASIVVGPLVGASTPTNFVGDPNHLAMFKKEAKTFILTVLDANDDPVDLTGFTLRFTVETKAATRAVLFTTSSITVSGAGNNIANVSVTTTNSDQTADEYEWRLWDDAGDQVLLHGDFTIVPTSET